MNRPSQNACSRGAFLSRLLDAREALVGLLESPAVNLFAGRGLALLLTFAVPLLLVRMLTVEDFGLYKQVFLLHSTLLAILQFGLPSSLLYFAVHDSSTRALYVFQTFVLLGCLAALGAALLLTVAPSIVDTFGGPPLRSLLLPTAILLVLSLLTSPLEPILLAVRAFGLVARVQFASESLRALLVIAAAGLFVGVRPIIWASIVWEAIRCLGMTVCLKRLSITNARWRLDASALSRQCRYALPFGAAVVVAICAETLHLYVVAFSFPLDVFATYSVGFLQVPLVGLAFQSVADVTLVRLTRLVHERRYSEIRAVISRAVRHLGAILCPLYIWLALNAHDLITILYTDRFLNSVPIFQISLLTIPLTVVALEHVPRAFADTTFILVVNVVRFGVAGALVLPLAATLGPSGAAAGTILAVAVTKAAIALRVSRLTRTSPWSLLPWRHLLHTAVLSLVCGVVSFLLTAALWPAPIVRLTVGTVLFLSGYVLFAWSLGILSPRDREQLNVASFLPAKSARRDA